MAPVSVQFPPLEERYIRAGIAHQVAEKWARRVKREATQNLSGRVLVYRSRKLVRSLVMEVTDTGQGRASASVGTAVPYGKFWEEGFMGYKPLAFFNRRGQLQYAMRVQIPARVITPRFAKALRFYWHGRLWIRSVPHPGPATIRATTRVYRPAQPWLAPAAEIANKSIRRYAAEVLRATLTKTPAPTEA